MKMELFELSKNPDLVENPLRILMVGSIDSGKSCFINSLFSTLMGRTIRKINFISRGRPGQSKTKEYRVYQTKLKKENGQEEKMPVRVCDMPGLACSEDQGESTPYQIKITDIINTIKGQFKSGHEFTEMINADDQSFDETPKLSKRVHGVCIALSVTECGNEKVTKQTNTLIESLMNIPFVIILTKIDLQCTSIDKIYQNPAVTEEAMYICEKIPSVKLSDIYPIKNYTHEVSVDDSLDLLILDAFKTLLLRCMDYVETLKDEDEDEDD